MDSLTIQEFREELVKTINMAELPMEIKRMVLMEIYQKVEQATLQEIEMIRNQNVMQEGETENGNSDEKRS